MMLQDKKPDKKKDRKQDTEKTIGRMAARLFAIAPEGYLSSEQFFRFCREEELEDVWQESLQRSRDRPDLYGDSVIKNAFILFLTRAFHSWPGEFLPAFIRFLAGFSRVTTRPLPLADLKRDLAGLGFPAMDLEKTFSVLRAREKDRLKRRKTGCPD
jgi:hypothetical protein